MKPNGFLIIDKPSGRTSRDVVNRVNRWFPRRTKIGHAGTLDPLATGVLVVGIGQATRLIEYVQDMPKIYRTEILLGARSTTDDADGELTVTPDPIPANEKDIRERLLAMQGHVEQLPPDYSALLIEGKRAYDLARSGAEVTLAPRTVRIDQIEVLRYEWPILELEVHCGKGTYIRSIARDLGDQLGMGGYVKTLRRMQIGSFTLGAAISMETEKSQVASHLLPIRQAVNHFPPITVSDDEIRRLRMGQAIMTAVDPELEAIAVTTGGDLVAIGKIANGLFLPDKVIVAEDTK